MGEAPPVRKLRKNKRGSYEITLPKDIVRSLEHQGWRKGADIEILVNTTGIRLRPKGDHVNCESRPTTT